MDRFWQLGMLIVVALPFATGCAGMHEARHSAMQSLGIESPTPATEFACAWQNRLAQLPDPTKNGASVTGLPGQMFLYAADGPEKLTPAVPVGELTIVVYDETPRPQGMPSKEPQTWHFGKDKLEKMAAVDEKFGKNFILFIPFLAEPGADWRDVSRVRLKARYDQTIEGKRTTLYAQETQVTLDFVRTPNMGTTRSTSMPGSSAGVPDPQVTMNQMRSVEKQQQQRAANWPMQQTMQQPVVSAGYSMPVQQQQQQIWAPQPVIQQPSNGGFAVPTILPPTQ